MKSNEIDAFCQGDDITGIRILPTLRDETVSATATSVEALGAAPPSPD